MEAPFILFVRSDVFGNGLHWEDGNPLEGIAFYVVAEDARGARWAHKKSWTRAMCHDCGQDDEGCYPCKAHKADPKLGCYTNEEAEAEGAKLIARIEAAMRAGRWAGPADNENWVSTDPAYGSEAYDGGAELARELHEEHVPMNEWPLAAQAAW